MQSVNIQIWIGTSWVSFWTVPLLLHILCSRAICLWSNLFKEQLKMVPASHDYSIASVKFVNSDHTRTVNVGQVTRSRSVKTAPTCGSPLDLRQRRNLRSSKVWRRARSTSSESGPSTNSDPESRKKRTKRSSPRIRSVRIPIFYCSCREYNYSIVWQILKFLFSATHLQFCFSSN